jgi:hypothetical protein
VILLALWRRGLLRRLNGEKLRYFLGRGGDPLLLSCRYPLWRRLATPRALLSPRHAAAVAAWLQYRVNLFDGVEG